LYQEIDADQNQFADNEIGEIASHDDPPSVQTIS